jgi:four helix bundle protein
MKDNNIIQDKSFAFAIRVVKLYEFLKEQKQKYVLSKQLLRAGTSIGGKYRKSNWRTN